MNRVTVPIPIVWAVLLVALAAPPSSLCADPVSDSAENWKRMAEDALQDELYLLAENYVKRFQQEAGEDPDAQIAAVLLNARALLGQGQAEKAETLLNTVAESDHQGPFRTDLAYWSARALYDQESYDKAIAVLDGLPVELQTPRSMRLRAKALAALRQIEPALAAFKALDQRYPNEASAPANLLDWAALLLQGQRGAEARTVLLNLLQRFPEQSEAETAQLWLSRDALPIPSRGDSKLEALASVATNKNVSSAVRMDAWYSLADLYAARTNYTESAAAFQAGEALSGDPSLRSLGILGRARLLVDEGKVVDGVKLAHEAVQSIDDEPLAARRLLDFAGALLDRGAYAEAFQEFQNVLEAFAIETGRDEAWMGKGWSLSELNRHGEAAEAFDKAVEVTTNNTLRARALIKSGDALFAAGKGEEARAHYVKFIADFPGQAYVPRAAYQVGECLVLLNQLKRAEEVFQSVETRYPDDPMAEQSAWRLAVLYEEAKAWTQAESAFSRVLKDYPDGALTAQSMQARGLTRYRLGRFYEALQDFEQVGGRFPESEQAEHALCMSVWSLYMLGREDEAMELAADFSTRYPSSRWAPHLLFWMAEVAFNQRAYDSAEKRFAAVAATFPKDPLADDGLYWAGRAASERKDYAAAMEYFRQFAQDYVDSPRMPEARFAQGDVLSSMGEFAGAILAFDEVLERFQDHFLADQARGRKGDCLFTLGAQEPLRYRESIEAYQAVADSPAAAAELKLQARYKMGRSFEKLADPDSALEHYLQVVYTFPEQPRERAPLGELWFSRSAFAAAAILEGREQWREAVHIYRRVVAAEVSASPDAQKRIQAVLFENWRSFLP